jgi:hypothetical protein
MSLRRYKVHLITFASGGFSNAQQWLARSALEFGRIDFVCAFSPSNIQHTKFYTAHRDILDAPRGAGYWLWKPYLILEKLTAVADGDFVIYWDCGRWSGYRFLRAVDPLLEWADTLGDGAMPGVSVPHYGLNAKWTKRDCFIYMDCDSERFWQHPQIQGTYSVWKKTRATTHFVATWLRYCCDPRIITDAPNTCGLDNLPGFVEHRHDQSVLTNLVIASGRPFMDGSLGFIAPIWNSDFLKDPNNPTKDFLKDPNNAILLARGWSAGMIYSMTRLRHSLDSLVNLVRRRASILKRLPGVLLLYEIVRYGRRRQRR